MNLLDEVRMLIQEDRLWSAADIAKYIGVSKSSVQGRLSVRPDFPKPIRLSDKNTRRWVPSEVKEWVLNQRH